MQPVEGSIQWAMNRGTLFQVDGGAFRYGQLVASQNSAQEAANVHMWKGEDYSVWLPPGTVLTVWNVYAGSIGGFIMKDPIKFIVRNGVPVPMSNHQDAPSDAS